MNGDGSVLANVLFKGLFTAHGLPLPLRDNGSAVNASREVIEYLTYLAKLLRQSAQRHVSQVKTREDSHTVHLFGCLLAYAPYFLNS